MAGRSSSASGCAATSREDFGLVTRVARYHNVYGPHGTYDGGREKAPAAIARKVARALLSGDHAIEIWGTGEQTRSFTFIDDCLVGTQAILTSETVTMPINLGSSEKVTINQLVDIVEDIAGVKLERCYNLGAPRGVNGRNSDNTLIKRLLGWEPERVPARRDGKDLRVDLRRDQEWPLQGRRGERGLTSPTVRLLVLNGDLPIFPGRAGHEYLHMTRLARLAQRVGLVSMVHTREMDRGAQGLVGAGLALYLWRSPDLQRLPAAAPRPSLWGRVGATVRRALGHRPGHPRDTRMQDLQFRNISGPLLEALRDESWQAVIVVQSNCARWVDYLPRPPVSVLVLHDVRALLYERQALAARSRCERWVLRREARRYRRFERDYCRRYDLVVTVSPADEAWVRTHYRPPRLATVAIPVDRAYFARMPEFGEVPGRIIFTGMMAHPPNADAAAFFAREVLPRVQAVVPEAEFWIVGRDPPPEVRQLALAPGVVVTGFVEDMRPYIAQASVVAVPLRFGSGMRNKILEAWAMEKCVVSTPVGAEGLESTDGVNILLAADAPALARRVIETLRDPGLRDRIRAGGRALVSTSHDPDALARRYYEVVAAAVRDASQRDDPLRALIDLHWMRRSGEASDTGSRVPWSIICCSSTAGIATRCSSPLTCGTISTRAAAPTFGSPRWTAPAWTRARRPFGPCGSSTGAWEFSTGARPTWRRCAGRGRWTPRWPSRSAVPPTGTWRP